MIVVTNRIKVKKGMAAALAPRFTRPSGLDTMEGFVRVEVLLTQGLEEHDEMNVNMYWEDMKHFEAWRNSDDFKASHKRPEPTDGKQEESPMLGSEIITYEVASVKERTSL